MTGAVTAEPSQAPSNVNGGLISTQYRFSTSIVAADPGAGRFRYDNATPASVLFIYISDTNDAGVDITNFLIHIADGDRLYIQQQNDASRFQVFNVTGDAIDVGAWFIIPVAIEATGAALANNARSLFVWQIAAADVVTKVGTPVDSEVGIWTGDGTLEGNDNLQFDTSIFSGRLEIKCVSNQINEIGFFMIDTDSVLNPDGWQLCPGQAGLFDGALILSHKPADVLNNRDVTFLPGQRPTFGFGIAIAPDTALADEMVGALAYFQPRDTTGREETKVSSIGFVGGTGHEGVFSVEGYNYGDSGLQFNRAAHFVTDADYVRHFDIYGKINIGLSLDAPTLSGDNAAIGYTPADGLALTGQGTSRDVTFRDDSNQIILSSQTGTSAWRFHKRFQVTTYLELQMGADDFTFIGAGACRDILWSGYDGLFRISSKLDVTGDLDVGGYTRTQVVTDAELNDITDAINTDAGKVQGAQLYNGDQDVPVWAVGNADGDIWVDGAGATVNTPV